MKKINFVFLSILLGSFLMTLNATPDYDPGRVENGVWIPIKPQVPSNPYDPGTVENGVWRPIK